MWLDIDVTCNICGIQFQSLNKEEPHRDNRPVSPECLEWTLGRVTITTINYGFVLTKREKGKGRRRGMRGEGEGEGKTFRPREKDMGRVTTTSFARTEQNKYTLENPPFC